MKKYYHIKYSKFHYYLIQIIQKNNKFLVNPNNNIEKLYIILLLKNIDKFKNKII